MGVILESRLRRNTILVLLIMSVDFSRAADNFAIQSA